MQHGNRERPVRDLGLSVAALGVVFGDIGTSPLYAFETAIAISGMAPDQAAIGVASLVLWALFLVVSVKYVLLVMGADYRGEGGIFALLALLREAARRSGARRLSVAAAMLFGAALLFGDGAITPAISVLSAVEGLESIEPDLRDFVLPITVVILASLFWVQRFGTGALGAKFGWIMLTWFLTLAGIGLYHLLKAPQVLLAVNPWSAIELFLKSPGSALPIVGAVVLAVTGAEALYADMGHFGRRPISRAWGYIVFPCLALNYLGQTAFILVNVQGPVDPNLFFLMAPHGLPRILLVCLATAATIIASQALISGVFSLSAQAIDLKYLPRLEVRHTSPTEPGQVFMPSVSLLLATTTLLLVFIFRTSEALAAAYGLAVTGAMAITSFAYCLVMRRSWGRPLWLSVVVLIALLALDLPLFIACMTKFFDGGFVPILIACAVGFVMFSWRRGYLAAAEIVGQDVPTLPEFSKQLEAGEFHRVPSTSVTVLREENEMYAVAANLEHYRRNKAFAERLVVLYLVANWRHAVAEAHAVRVQEYPGNVWTVLAKHGYMREPDVPRVMRLAERASKGRFVFDPENTMYVIPHKVIYEHSGSKLGPLQRKVFAFLSKVVLPSPEYLNIPADRLVIANWVLRL